MHLNEAAKNFLGSFANAKSLASDKALDHNEETGFLEKPTKEKIVKFIKQMKLESKTRKELQQAQKIVENKKLEIAFRKAVANLGDYFRTDGSPQQLAERLNHFIEVNELSNKKHNVKLPSQLLTKLARHESYEVRRLAARLLPENLAFKHLALDKNSYVRNVITQRAPLPILEIMKKHYPDDDLLSEAIEVKKEEFKNSFVVDNDSRVQPLELSDVWYETQARKILEDQGMFSRVPPFIETNHWKKLAVSRYVSSYKSTYGIPLDGEKLLNAVDKLINDIELKRSGQFGYTLSEAKQMIQDGIAEEMLMSTEICPIITEHNDGSKDIVRTFMKSIRELNSYEYIRMFESTFNLKKGNVPDLIKRQYLGEGAEFLKQTIPSRCSMPRMDEDVERIVSAYVNNWNRHNQNFNIGWVSDNNDVLFTIREK